MSSNPDFKASCFVVSSEPNHYVIEDAAYSSSFFYASAEGVITPSEYKGVTAPTIDTLVWTTQKSCILRDKDDDT